MIRISLITIGSELLKGSVVNTNASQAGRMLRQQGYSLSRVISISDSPQAIVQTLEAELAQHDIVLMSGGLGPTRDDLTKRTLASFFNTELVIHQPSLDRITRLFAQRNLSLTKSNRQQAYLPQGCEVLPNAKGTAPGLLFSQDKKRLFSMPGVPFEMLYMLRHEVIPRIIKIYPPGFAMQQVIRLNGIPESYAADRLMPIETNLPPAISLSYLPKRDGLWLELSALVTAKEKAVVDKQLQAIKKQIKELFRQEFYIEGDLPIESHIGTFLKQKKLTLAIAESITGGKIAAKVVAISGASTYFKGSITAYDTSVKIDLLGVSKAEIAAHTVVSEVVAKQMAEGVRQLLGADIGISSTGIAELNPPQAGELARAWLGYADRFENSAQLLHLPNDRHVSIERAANYALINCWKKIQAHFE